MKELEYWLNKESQSEMYTFDYWNNEEKEKEKEWYILDESDDKVKKYLKTSGLQEEFEIAIQNSTIKGKVLDLAAGTCWSSALVSKLDSVTSVDAVEFSLHRIETLAPRVIESLNGKKMKIHRILGSFYDIQRDDEHYDTIILSSAYHHAEFPLKLFHECDRVLKKGGTIIIVGENIISYKRIFGRFIKNLFKFKIKIDISSEYYNNPSDPLGDHYYMVNDYIFTFVSYGYSYKVIKTNIRNSKLFVAIK